MKDTKILQHSLKEYKLTLILTLYITSGICRRWAKQQKVNSNFTFQIKNNQLKIKTNILSCKFSKCDPVSELLSIFCLLSGLPAGDDLLELAPDGAAHDHQAVSLAVPHALHSCLEAQTQFFELFNNTFNIFPVLLAPTMDICKVSNPQQKEIEDFGLQS